MTDEPRADYEFSVAPDDRFGRSFSVARNVAGQPQHRLVMISYESGADADYLAQTLRMLEARRVYRRTRELRAKRQREAAANDASKS